MIDFYLYVGGRRDSVLSSQTVINITPVNSREGRIKIRRKRVSNQVIIPSKQNSVVIEINGDRWLLFCT